MSARETGPESGFVALAEYIRAITEAGYPARVVLQSACTCRGTHFRLEADETEGCARRICVDCGAEAFIGDSEEYWNESEPESARCACGGDAFQVAVGFSFREDDEIQWLTLGTRCTRCGLLDSPADWKIDYAPTDHLFEKT
jgi:hypothetical protein